MSDFSLECPYPGATTCIVIGPITTAAARRLTPFRALLWFTRGTSTFPAELHGCVLEQVDVSGAQPSLMLEIVDRFVARDPRRLPTLFASGAGGDTLKEVVESVHGALDSHHRARVTRQADGYTWQQHVLQNLPEYLRRRVPESWRDHFRGVPAFICGAGPSLDASAPALARVANQGIVFAADSALRKLHRHGIAADFAVSIDVAKHPGKCLGEDTPLPPHVVLSTLSPAAWWQQAAPGRCWFLSGRQITEDWLAGRGAAKTHTPVTENCGATALELARFFGCAPIYLFGMDLALDENAGGRRHASEVDARAYVNSGFNAADSHPRIPGNYVASVPTHVLGDWRALDDRLARWPAGLVVNVTDRGARLRSATLCSPSELCLTGAVPTPELLPPAAFTSEIPAITTHIAATTARARSLVEEASRAAARGDITAAANVLRRAMVDRELSRLLGAYSLKAMPHLVPPLEGSPAFWSQLVEEFATLIEQAKAIGEVKPRTAAEVR